MLSEYFSVLICKFIIQSRVLKVRILRSGGDIYCQDFRQAFISMSVLSASTPDSSNTTKFIQTCQNDSSTSYPWSMGKKEIVAQCKNYQQGLAGSWTLDLLHSRSFSPKARILPLNYQTRLNIIVLLKIIIAVPVSLNSTTIRSS